MLLVVVLLCVVWLLVLWPAPPVPFAGGSSGPRDWRCTADAHLPAPQPQPQPQPQAIPKPQARLSTPLIDPATIIDWKQGLRCVSKIAASNPEFAGKVRKLVRDQEGNVGMWEEGRRRVVVEQRGKREGEVRRRGEL